MLINVHCICLIFVVCSVSKRKTTLVIVVLELIYVCYLMYQSIILLWFVLYTFVIVIYLENCLAVFLAIF